jgi:hypothetical protein
MSNILPFFHMDALAAARFNELTIGRENRLVPRKVDAGTYFGKYVLPERVKVDPAHEEFAAMFVVLPVAAIDVDLAWPPPPDE